MQYACVLHPVAPQGMSTFADPPTTALAASQLRLHKLQVGAAGQKVKKGKGGK